jgi:hypothetical protein
MRWALQHRERPRYWFCSFGCGYSSNEAARKLYSSREIAFQEAAGIAKSGKMGGYSYPVVREVCQ